MGVASNDDDGGVGEVDADEQLDGRPQAFGMASGVGKYPEKPRQEVRASTSKKIVHVCVVILAKVLPD